MTPPSNSIPSTFGCVAAADPIDIATVRSLWAALHPDEPVPTIVDELVVATGGQAAVLQEAMRQLRCGQLDRNALVVGRALAVLERTLDETSGAPSRSGG